MSNPTHDRRVVIVTGAARGIGAATAAGFAASGDRVVVADVDRVGAEQVARSLPGAIAVVTDVSDPGAVERLRDRTVKEYGRIDVLINNAMVCHEGSLLELDVDAITRDIAVNLVGPMLVARAVLPVMIERRSGVILNVSSVNGLTALGDDAYSAAKAGLLQLTRTIAMRHGPDGVRCNAVAPATIATEYWQQRDVGPSPQIDSLSSWYPLARIGSCADVVSALHFLASDAAAWITGVVLPVDGGLTAGNRRLAEDLTAGSGR